MAGSVACLGRERQLPNTRKQAPGCIPKLVVTWTTVRSAAVSQTSRSGHVTPGSWNVSAGRLLVTCCGLVLRTQPRSHHQLGMHGSHPQGQSPVPGVAVSMARRATNSKAHTKAPSRQMPGEVKIFHAPTIWVDYRPRQRCQSRCETSRGRRDIRHAARRPHQH